MTPAESIGYSIGRVYTDALDDGDPDFVDVTYGPATAGEEQGAAYLSVSDSDENGKIKSACSLLSAGQCLELANRLTRVANLILTDVENRSREEMQG